MKKIILIIFSVIVGVFILFFPYAHYYSNVCRCGGCCVGCPGDCNTLGFPLAHYYWGTNALTGENVSEFAYHSFSVNMLLLIVMIYLFYSKFYKSKNKS